MGPSMSNPVADYLHELYLIAGVSVPETSGYPALSKLLNNVGESLKPKITAVIHPSNNGAGIPDGGLFSAKELRTATIPPRSSNSSPSAASSR
jgi:hypothetical protein